MLRPGHPQTRPPAVAGRFYPADPERLAIEVDELLAEPGRGPRCPKAVIAPHAGYIYSGPTAGLALAAFAPDAARIERVVLLGPSHYVPVAGLAASSADLFETPLGPIPVDTELRDELLQLPQVQIDDSAHAREHSLEVMLPFLQRLIDDFTVVPLTVGDASPGEVAEVLDRAWGTETTRIVVSSDLSHYHDYQTAQTMDRKTCLAIEHLDPRRVSVGGACGRQALNGLLETARRRGLAVTTLDLRNSGDTAGPRDNVVGYGAWAFS